MEDRLMTLGIRVAAGPGADSEETADAAVRLRRELLDLDVEAVEMPRSDQPPPGTRAADLTDLGALLVTFGPQLLSSVVAAVYSWMSRSGRRSIRLELDGDALELTAVSSGEQRRLTDEWLRRHASG